MRKFIVFTAVVTGLMGFSACSQTVSQAEPEVSSAVQNKFALSNVNAIEANQLLAAKDEVVVLDVRTPAEYASGHIEGALNIDFKNANFATQLSELDRDTEYVIHCRSGGRSTKSISTFEELGFTNITHLDGGILAWNQAELPLVQN